MAALKINDLTVLRLGFSHRLRLLLAGAGDPKEVRILRLATHGLRQSSASPVGESPAAETPSR